MLFGRPGAAGDNDRCFPIYAQGMKQIAKLVLAGSSDRWVVELDTPRAHDAFRRDPERFPAAKVIGIRHTNAVEQTEDRTGPALKFSKPSFAARRKTRIGERHGNPTAAALRDEIWPGLAFDQNQLL